MKERSLFSVEQWVINTKRKNAPTVKAVLSETYPTIYVLYDADTDEYYMENETNLIKYDKYWLDSNRDGDC